MARTRVPLPTAEELMAEAQKERRRIRRAERHALKNGEAEAPVILPPVESSGAAKSPEELRAMFDKAFDTLGGVEALVAWGRNYPKEFYPMWARICIPKEVKDGGAAGTGLEDMLAQLDEEDK